MSYFQLRLQLFLLGIGLLGGQAFIQAQEGGGVLAGTVTDRSNAVVPGFMISITHTGTGLTRTSVTDTSGGYAFRALPIGTYDVTATGSGFATLRSTGAEVSVGSTTRLDLQVQVATVTQDVIVQAQAAVLNTESGAGGVLLSSSQVTNLPLNGRNFLQLVALEPGVRQNSTTGRQSFVFNGTPPGHTSNRVSATHPLTRRSQTSGAASAGVGSRRGVWKGSAHARSARVAAGGPSRGGRVYNHRYGKPKWKSRMIVFRRILRLFGMEETNI